MTISQIQYFLEVADCRNISEAARHLFITQPTLGRQLTSMEKELNMQLIIRSNHGIQLTPAGLVLYEQFRRLMDIYRDGVEKAAHVSKGFSGELSIGILDGLNVNDIIPKVIEYFEETFPQIELNIRRMSFGEILDGFSRRWLDTAISLDVNFLSRPELEKYNLKPYIPAFAVPINHPLARKESLGFKDFKDVPLAIVDQDECALGVKRIADIFQEYGGFYPNFYFTPVMRDALFWVESGQKCALLNMEMQIVDSPGVKMYPIEPFEETVVQLAIPKGGFNIAVGILLDFLKD